MLGKDSPRGTLPAPRETGPVRLMSKPQALGILPSIRFWREIQKSEPGLHLFVTFAWAMFVMPIVLLCAMFVPPFWPSAITIVLVSTLATGVLEKLLRRTIVRRRRRAADHVLMGEPRGELPPANRASGPRPGA